MRILLLGEYSNVHATLAKGLRRLGHRVTVVSNGDFWKDYPRDIDVSRHGTFGGLRLYLRLLLLLPRLRGYDIVQLINPMFFEIKAERLYFFYHYLRRHNRRIVLGGFGMDYYWVHECITRFPLRYSDFNFGTEIRQDREAQKYIREWIATPKGDLCRYIANDCDKIITGLYEYCPFSPTKRPIVLSRSCRVTIRRARSTAHCASSSASIVSEVPTKVRTSC